MECSPGLCALDHWLSTWPWPDICKSVALLIDRGVKENGYDDQNLMTQVMAIVKVERPTLDGGHLTYPSVIVTPTMLTFSCLRYRKGINGI